MIHIVACLLTLLFSLSGPAMGKYSDFERSSNAAKTPTYVQMEFPFARGASIQTPGVTTAGETFVRVGNEPTSQPMALAVPTHVKMKSDKLLGDENPSVEETYESAFYLRFAHLWRTALSSIYDAMSGAKLAYL